MYMFPATFRGVTDKMVQKLWKNKMLMKLKVFA